jgi:hypothetical protein
MAAARRLTSLINVASLGAMGRGAGDVGDHTALGIFFRLQVTDFDGFLFLVLHVVTYLLVGCLLFVLCQWHRTAIDGRPSRPVLESGHPDESIYLCCAWAFDCLTLRRAHSFCSSVYSLGYLCYQYPCQVV